MSHYLFEECLKEFKDVVRNMARDFARYYVPDLYATPKNWRWWHAHSAPVQPRTENTHFYVFHYLRRALHGYNAGEAARHKRKATLQKLRVAT